MSRGTGMGDRARHVAKSGPLERILEGPIQFGRDWLVGFVRLQGFDRAVALAGQTFTALIPLLIVYSAVVSRKTGNDFADQIIKAFDLHGTSATTVKQAIASSNEVENEVSVFSALLLIVSALSFTRGLQRLYQLAFDQTSLGLRAAKWGLIWLAVVIAILTVRPVVLSPFHGLTLLMLSIGVSSVLWLVTPYILLARRVPWKRLVATAVLTSIGMTGLTVASAIWMPHSVAVSAEQFGTIGIAFALLSWLVGAGMVLVVAAAGGSVIDTRLRERANR